MANKVIDPAPIIKQLADRCLKAKGVECSVLGRVIDLLKAAPAVYNAPYWATEEAYKNGYEAGKKEAGDKWVPTEERLPERFQPVIVCRKGGKVETGWRDVNDWWRVYGTRVKTVTHWKPLPEAPKEC